MRTAQQFRQQLRRLERRQASGGFCCGDGAAQSAEGGYQRCAETLKQLVAIRKGTTV